MRDVGRLKGTTQMRSMEKRPLAQPWAMVSGKAWRFTVLTPALIRVEYDAEGSFNDAPNRRCCIVTFPSAPLRRKSRARV